MECPNDGFAMSRHYHMVHVCPKCYHSVSTAMPGTGIDHTLLILQNQRALIISHLSLPGDAALLSTQLTATDQAIKELKGETDEQV